MPGAGPPLSRRTGSRTRAGCRRRVDRNHGRYVVIEEHFAALHCALESTRSYAPRIRAWGEHLATQLTSGSRLLTCGNGGSAAEAQHLTGELVGRFLSER